LVPGRFLVAADLIAGAVRGLPACSLKPPADRVVTKLVTCCNCTHAGDRPSDSKGILSVLPTFRRSDRAWFAVATKARWANPAEIKQQFGSTVDFVGDNRVIFDLGGNKYRLIVHVSFASAAYP